MSFPPFISKQTTYKCLALRSMSRPGAIPLETGMVPLSSLSLRSSQERLVKLPIEGGIGPLKLLEFKDLPNKKYFSQREVIAEWKLRQLRAKEFIRYSSYAMKSMTILLNCLLMKMFILLKRRWLNNLCSLSNNHMILYHEDIQLQYMS